MLLEPLQYALGCMSGSFVGFSLGLFGGGGSILAVPLMVYLVGVPNVHLAIGTSAFAVAVNAGANVVSHARKGNVNWRCATVYSGAGVAGAFMGSTLGKAIDGQNLLLLFAVLMLVVAALMVRGRRDASTIQTVCTRETAPKTLIFGAATGAFAGFFGIGGGFLIVPSLIAATGMPILSAIGSSLVAVTAFGAATALNYAATGQVDWLLAIAFIVGGIAGGTLGARVAARLALRRGVLNAAFAGLLVVVATYVAVGALST